MNVSVIDTDPEAAICGMRGCDAEAACGVAIEGRTEIATAEVCRDHDG